MKNVNDGKWPLYGLSVMLGTDVHMQLRAVRSSK